MTKAELAAQVSALQNELAARNANPTTTAAVPGFVQSAKPLPASGLLPITPAARTFKRGGHIVSKAGYPQTIYTTATKNGAEFRCSVPSDLVAAIRAGL